MANEKQNETPFQDPLENYDPPTFDDPIEQALHEETVMAIQSRPYACVPIDTTVQEVLQTLVGEGIACVLIENQGKLVGLVSDRDILEKVALEYADVKDKSVQEVMTASPVYVDELDSAASALAVASCAGAARLMAAAASQGVAPMAAAGALAGLAAVAPCCRASAPARAPPAQ